MIDQRIKGFSEGHEALHASVTQHTMIWAIIGLFHHCCFFWALGLWECYEIFLETYVQQLSCVLPEVGVSPLPPTFPKAAEKSTVFTSRDLGIVREGESVRGRWRGGRRCTASSSSPLHLADSSEGSEARRRLKPATAAATSSCNGDGDQQGGIARRQQCLLLPIAGAETMS
ncbi:hypothetical protein Taro_006363 [Colocasia esculenta]|uniref:Uncharacterized protein n=1 Tax=Colocasia esculenta TaxID=4460 RepID=A0A843TSH1_COLES|nr:hypothetical protein [Colocasia esculenta]